MPPSAAYQRARSGHALTAILLPPCEVQPNSTNPTRFPHRGGQLAGKPIKHDQLSISCAVGVGRWPLPTEIGTRDSNRDSKFTPLERRHTDRTEMSYFEHRLVSPLVHIHPDVDYARCGARVHEVRGRREKTAPERCSALPSEALYAASCNHVATSAQTSRKRKYLRDRSADND